MRGFAWSRWLAYDSEISLTMERPANSTVMAGTSPAIALTKIQQSTNYARAYLPRLKKRSF
jgi:hypothetical protein